MIFATYQYNGKEQVGVVDKKKNKIIPLSQVIGEMDAFTMSQLIEKWNQTIYNTISAKLNNEDGIDLNEVQLLAPIPHPKRGIICLGKNYKEHVKEMDSKSDLPENPIFFCKLVDRAIGHLEEIPSHIEETKQLDYEVELGVIIGKEGKNIKKEEVEDYIFGYTIINDITARDLQKKHNQWFRGKSLDGCCPMGPYVILKNQISFPPSLEIKSFVNGETRQSSNTKELIFDIPYIISEFSKGITLKLGDIISTGTPSGVGMGFTPIKVLQPGDIVTCYIENIGTIENTIK